MQDSAGGKTSSTKSGSGPLDFFGGSSSQSSLPSGGNKLPAVAAIPNDGALTFVAGPSLMEMRSLWTILKYNVLSNTSYSRSFLNSLSFLLAWKVKSW